MFLNISNAARKNQRLLKTSVFNDSTYFFSVDARCRQRQNLEVPKCVCAWHGTTQTVLTRPNTLVHRTKGEIVIPDCHTNTLLATGSKLITVN